MKPSERTAMEKIDQTEFGPQGNCQSACLAMLLGIPLTDVPNFAKLAADSDNSAAYKEQDRWLEERGWAIVTIVKWQALPWPPKNGCYIAGGISPRGMRHGVVYQNGELWHDPHPSREGIIDIDDVDILFPIRMPFISTVTKMMEYDERLFLKERDIRKIVREELRKVKVSL